MSEADVSEHEVEMLPEYSSQSPPIVVVLGLSQTASLSGTDRIMKLLVDQALGSPLPEQQMPPERERRTPLAPAKGTTRSSTSSRQVFTDYFNSMWHFVFGMFALKFPLLVPLFIGYQCLDIHEVNIFVDIGEFLWGYVFGWLFTLI
jgi:hypothetical protein